MLSVVLVEPARAGGAVLETIQSPLGSIRNGTGVIRKSEIEPPLPILKKRTAPLGPFCCPGQANPLVMCLLLLDTTSAPVSHRHMRSQLADAACRSLREDVKRMTPEQRLAEFLSHCQLMAQLANSEVAGQHPPRNAVSPNALAHPASRRC